MPLPVQAGSSSQAADEPFHSPYRTEASFKNFSAFLNRTITLNSRFPNQSVKFPLLDILKHLGVNQAYLKGSSVHHWKDEQTPADIDFQLHCHPAEQGQQLADRLLDFLDTAANRARTSKPEVREKYWFSKVARDFHGAWHRMVISVGYPGPKATTLDLNFTNRPQVSYDTIHASKAIYVNWERKKTAVVDSWHPALVEWMQQARLLWFNPEIDEGLGRLSYRLSKSTDMQLLQPGIANRFFQQANTASLGSVYMRILLGEYGNSSLSTAEQAQLWEAVVDAANAGSSRQHQSLLMDMLAWSKFKQIDQLKQALVQPEMQETAVQRLKQGGTVGADFKVALRHVLQAEDSFKDRLQPLVGKALGANLMRPEQLFGRLDNWEQIQNIPEHELQSVFSDYLDHWREQGDAATQQRCMNIQGWLQGDELSSLKFWMDRVPARMLSSPPERLSGPVVQAALQLIKSKGVAGLGEALPSIENLRLQKEPLFSLISTLQDSRTVPGQPTIGQAENRQGSLAQEFFNLLVNHADLFSEKPGQPLPTASFLSDCLAFSSRAQAERLPPLIRSLVSVKNGVTAIELDGASLIISGPEQCARLEKGRRQVLSTGYCVVQSNTPTAGGPRELQIDWRDGSTFIGSMPAGKSAFCTGKLSQGEQKPVPELLKGLLETGRRLCLSKLANTEFQQNLLFAEGQFHASRLFRAQGFESALQTLNEGAFYDRSPGQFISICHDFRDDRPEACNVTINSANETPSLMALYASAQQGAADLADFNNPWQVVPKTDRVQAQHYQMTAPLGGVLLTSLFPWNPEARTLDGWGEVIGTGDMEFIWKGLFSAGEPSNRGSLYLSESSQPVIVFESEESTSAVPLSLMPVMADLLGKRLMGNYPFSAKVWHEEGTWPPAGFEGFVNRFANKQYTFSGYVSSTGRAIGILGYLGQDESTYYSAFSGNFMIQPKDIFRPAPLTIDGQAGRPLRLPVRDNMWLAPHGLVQEFMITKGDNTPAGRIDRVYFCGQGLSMNQISQDPELVYQAPNKTAYLQGMGYTDRQKPLQVDFMFNHGDGGEDFVRTRPAGFEREANFRESYVDASGIQATWVLVNKEYRMGQIHFPCGLEYSGQVNGSGDFFNLQGQGKISLGELAFSARFREDGMVTDLQPKTRAAGDWLATYSRASGPPTFKLDEFIELISGGLHSYSVDMQPHLLIRRPEAAGQQAIVFSRE